MKKTLCHIAALSLLVTFSSCQTTSAPVPEQELQLADNPPPPDEGQDAEPEQENEDIVPEQLDQAENVPEKSEETPEEPAEIEDIHDEQEIVPEKISEKDIEIDEYDNPAAEKMSESDISEFDSMLNAEIPEPELVQDEGIPETTAEAEEPAVEKQEEAGPAVAAEPEKIKEPEPVPQESVEKTAPKSEPVKNEPFLVKQEPVKPVVIPAPSVYVEEDEEEPAVELENIVTSRSVKMDNSQYLDIVYPGAGWIYLGENDNDNRFIFFGRKLGNKETVFTLRSKKPGISILHFYKNDPMTGSYIDDYLEVEVSSRNAMDDAHITAPSYADIIPKRPDQAAKSTASAQKKTSADVPEKKVSEADGKLKNEGAPISEHLMQEKADQTEKSEIPASNTVIARKTQEKVQTVIQTAEKGSPEQESSPDITKQEDSGNGNVENKELEKHELPDSIKKGSVSDRKNTSARSLLEKAQNEYKAKNYTEALSVVQQFFDVATTDFDKGLFLEGQILEAKSEVQNIKSALDAYDTLIKNWPASPLWKKANERSIYLRRFYFDIR